MNNTLVLYHRNCPSGDGFGAALAAWLKYGHAADYVASDYGDAPPDVSGKDVFILDLSYPADVLARMSEQASSLVLLDHHVTAQRSLASFKPVCCGKIHFDLNKCGAVMAWEHFHAGKPMPLLFSYLQDRDLWHWQLEGSKEFLTWLDSRPKTFDAWSKIALMTAADVQSVRPVGQALAEQHARICESIASKPSPVVIAGVPGLMVNASGEFRSEVGSLMAEQSGTFGMVWRVAEDGTVLVSLRSVKSDNHFDVEALALKFGGGGHATAASFRLPPSALLALATGTISAP